MPLPIIRHRDDWDECLGLLPLRDGSGFRTLSVYRVMFDWGDLNYYFQVPKGFHTDLASIPTMFKPLFGTWGKHTAASVVHDCFYSYKAGTKEMADDLFEAIMVLDGVEAFDARIMTSAVRIAGDGSWEAEDGEKQPQVKVLGTEGTWVNP